MSSLQLRHSKALRLGCSPTPSGITASFIVPPQNGQAKTLAASSFSVMLFNVTRDNLDHPWQIPTDPPRDAVALARYFGPGPRI
jgi:hypothetical protein